MNSQQPTWWERFLWRMAGALIFIAMVSKPDAAECSSADLALRAWLLRSACAAGWAFWSLSFGSATAAVDSLRITPGPATPNEVARSIDTEDEEKPRINFLLVVSTTLIVFIGELLSDKTNLTLSLASPQTIAAWLDVIISTAFWSLFVGAFARRPRRNEALPNIEIAEERPANSHETTAARRGIDRPQWIMFALFFSVCFAVSLWANHGDIHLGRTWLGALEYCGKLMVMSASLAFFWALIPALFSSTDPELLRITPPRTKPNHII
jgi:hypothetical protein